MTVAILKFLGRLIASCLLGSVSVHLYILTRYWSTFSKCFMASVHRPHISWCFFFFFFFFFFFALVCNVCVVGYSLFSILSFILIDRLCSVTVITKTCLYNFDPLKPHFFIVKLGVYRVFIIFYFCSKT